LVGKGREEWFPPAQTKNKSKIMEDEFEIQQEEEQEKPKLLKKEIRAISMKRAVVAVLGLHLIALGGIIFFSSQPKVSAQEDKRFLENLPQVGVDAPTPTPSPKPKVVTIVPKNISPNYPQYTKEYVVKQGDTFYGIVNRYKLNPTKLKLINNIKDENKLYVGQKLKFMQ
jgi:nucleoid-associated protein YgaU